MLCLLKLIVILDCIEYLWLLMTTKLFMTAIMTSYESMTMF